MAPRKKLPLTNNVVLDQAAVLELIDQLRVAVPDEVRAGEAHHRGGRPHHRARPRGGRRGHRPRPGAGGPDARGARAGASMAQQRAAEIIDTANAEAAEVRRGADEYAAGVLIRLEGECIKALTSIKRGIDMLDERHRLPRPADRTGPSSDRAWSRRRPKPPPGHDRVQRRGPAPGGARGDPRGRACATATSRSAPTSSWPGRSTACSASSAPTVASWCAATSRRPLRRTCARCLEPFVEAVSIRDLPRSSCPASTRRPAPAVERDEPTTRRSCIDDHHEIDLDPGPARRARAHRADASALPAGLSRPVPGVRRAAGWRTTCAARDRRARSAPGRPGRLLDRATSCRLIAFRRAPGYTAASH